MPLRLASATPASTANLYGAQPMAWRQALTRPTADAVDTAEFMPQRYSCFSTTVNPEIRGSTRSRKNTNCANVLRMSFDPEQRRAALNAFIKTHSLKVLPWCTAAGLNEASLRGFLAKRTRSLSDETYVLLADAAAELLGRAVTAAELRGELPRTVEVPLRHYVGAGDEVHIIDGDEAIDYVEAPPGYAKGAAAIVRGESMRPTYDPGDLLFFRRREDPPAFKELPPRPVIVQIKDGRLLVKKLLPGTKRGRYHLLSVNPLTPVLQDQAVESIARIGWIKPVE